MARRTNSGGILNLAAPFQTKELQRLFPDAAAAGLTARPTPPVQPLEPWHQLKIDGSKNDRPE